MFARHQDDALNPCGDRLFNGVLDCRAINDWEELLRHRLRCGEEACPPAGNGEDCGADVHARLRVGLSVGLDLRIAATPTPPLLLALGAGRRAAVRQRAAG